MFLNCRTVSGVMCYSGKSRLIYKQYNVDCNKASCIFLVLARPRQIVSQETTVCTYYVPFKLEPQWWYAKDTKIFVCLLPVVEVCTNAYCSCIYFVMSTHKYT